jgi:hypothetical protein
MADVVVEYKGGVVEEVTILGQPARVFVLDWVKARSRVPAPSVCLGQRTKVLDRLLQKPVRYTKKQPVSGD